MNNDILFINEFLLFNNEFFIIQSTYVNIITFIHNSLALINEWFNDRNSIVDDRIFILIFLGKWNVLAYKYLFKYLV